MVKISIPSESQPKGTEKSKIFPSLNLTLEEIKMAKRFKCKGTTSFSSMNEVFALSAKNYEEARIKAIIHLLKQQSKEDLKWEKDFADIDTYFPLEIKIALEEV